MKNSAEIKFHCRNLSNLKGVFSKKQSMFITFGKNIHFGTNFLLIFKGAKKSEDVRTFGKKDLEKLVKVKGISKTLQLCQILFNSDDLPIRKIVIHYQMSEEKTKYLKKMKLTSNLTGSRSDRWPNNAKLRHMTFKRKISIQMSKEVFY